LQALVSFLGLTAHGALSVIDKPCVVPIARDHRLFYFINTLSIAASAIETTICLVTRQPIPTGPEAGISLDCEAVPLTVRLHASASAFLTALQGGAPAGIRLNIIERPPLDPNLTKTMGLASVLRAMFVPHFVMFIEAYKDWLINNVNKDRYKWPAELSFAVVIRDAISHNGIQIRSKKNDSVSWHGITYSAANTGRDPFSSGDLAFGDLVLLMLDAGRRLDEAGCPIIA
jgi:hypothetical protein